MNRDRTERDVVTRSREVSEARWPGIKDELEAAKSISFMEIACAPAAEPEDRGSFIPPTRRSE
jgi:hypothetical protein